MNGIGNWLRSLGQKISYSMRSFMMGRYGTDKLNMAILGAGVVICLISMFIKAPLVNLILTFLSYGCMFWAIFRSFSRKTYLRYQENRKFLMMLDQIKDRDHRYYDCPRCRQGCCLRRVREGHRPLHHRYRCFHRCQQGQGHSLRTAQRSDDRKADP